MTTDPGRAGVLHQEAYIKKVLDSHGRNRGHAARAPGIDRRTLYRKLDKP